MSIYIYISFFLFKKYPSPLTKNERMPAVTLHETATHTHTEFVVFFLQKIKCNIQNKQIKKACFTIGFAGEGSSSTMERKTGAASFSFILFFQSHAVPTLTLCLASSECSTLPAMPCSPPRLFDRPPLFLSLL